VVWVINGAEQHRPFDFNKSQIKIRDGTY